MNWNIFASRYVRVNDMIAWYELGLVTTPTPVRACIPEGWAFVG